VLALKFVLVCQSCVTRDGVLILANSVNEKKGVPEKVLSKNEYPGNSSRGPETDPAKSLLQLALYIRPLRQWLRNQSAGSHSKPGGNTPCSGTTTLTTPSCSTIN
jgi:hypothetical protein